MDAPQIQVAEPNPPPGVSQTASAAPYRAATDEEANLCRTASHVDWVYLGGMALADAGSVVLDTQVFQSSGQTGVRLVGPALVGLSWGWSIGGAYLTLPQCSSDFVRTVPLEGTARSEWPLALSFTLLAAAMGPIIVGVDTGEGTQTLTWSPAERVMRLVIASGTGVVGSVLPYVLPPRTWRAARKLEHLTVTTPARGAVLSYAVVF